MSIPRVAILSWGWLFILVMGTSADAYLVGPALKIDQLVEKADFVCKAVAVSSRVVDDPWFEKHQGFDITQTDLRILAVYKGAPLTTSSFRHYALNARGPMM